LMIMLVLYAVHVVNWLSGYRLNAFGIYPRKFSGLRGIIFSPFLHANFNHLFFNSIPLFILVSFVLLNGMHAFVCVTITIMVLSGVAVWLVGRPAYHIGASGVIMGYWGYLLLYAYEHTTVISVALAVVCIYYFGGLIFNLFPTKVKSSWEAHFFGFLSGLAAAYTCPLLLCKYGTPLCWIAKSSAVY
jgi:membrane associated rhomboid family serine protease